MSCPRTPRAAPGGSAPTGRRSRGSPSSNPSRVSRGTSVGLGGLGNQDGVPGHFKLGDPGARLAGRSAGERGELLELLEGGGIRRVGRLLRLTAALGAEPAHDLLIARLGGHLAPGTTEL